MYPFNRKLIALNILGLCTAMVLIVYGRIYFLWAGGPFYLVVKITIAATAPISLVLLWHKGTRTAGVAFLILAYLLACLAVLYLQPWTPWPQSL